MFDYQTVYKIKNSNWSGDGNNMITTLLNPFENLHACKNTNILLFHCSLSQIIMRPKQQIDLSSNRL